MLAPALADDGADRDRVRERLRGEQLVAPELVDLETQLLAELEELFDEQNTSDGATSIPATFLRVTVRR